MSLQKGPALLLAARQIAVQAAFGKSPTMEVAYDRAAGVRAVTVTPTAKSNIGVRQEAAY